MLILLPNEKGKQSSCITTGLMPGQDGNYVCDVWTVSKLECTFNSSCQMLKINLILFFSQNIQLISRIFSSNLTTKI